MVARERLAGLRQLPLSFLAPLTITESVNLKIGQTGSPLYAVQFATTAK